jgi:hypothetical protein
MAGKVQAQCTFSDVPESHVFYDYITGMCELGITTGYPDGTYRPSQNVTRGQMSAFIMRTIKPKCNWECPDDDVANNIYRVCNYFPLDPNNRWKYTTGNRFILDNTQTCTSGYSGILYGSNDYEFDSYIQNCEHGLLFAGCQYHEDGLEDGGIQLEFIPSEMQMGQTVSKSLPPSNYYDWAFTLDTKLVGLETVTVPAGTFNNTLKIELLIAHWDGSCSYKETLWLAKGIGPVKIHRTDANPSDCLGCVFICDPDNDIDKLNTPAELIAAIIKGVKY